MTPIVMAIALYFLWQILGVACLAGLAYLFVMLPAASQYIARRIIVLQVRVDTYTMISTNWMLARSLDHITLTVFEEAVLHFFT